MTEPAPQPPSYPTGIVAGPFVLDGVVFAPSIAGQIERAVRCCNYIGDVLHDDNRFWLARKHDARGEMIDWRPMRCAAEARAFIVSKVRQ